ncbi:MAG: hypothetical protein FRDTV1_gp1 [Hangzhou totivirus 12]|nr:MAG: hypothetical protein FRDTV1_gp1 [Hangzhou totivirus 12]
MNSTTKENTPGGIGSSLSQTSSFKNALRSASEMTCGISPLVPREQREPATITPGQEEKLMQLFRQGNEGRLALVGEQVASTSQVAAAPNTPRRNRKRKRHLYADGVASEAVEVRRSQRIANQRGEVGFVVKRPKLGNHSYTPTWNLPHLLSDYQDLAILTSGPGFLDQKAGLFNGATEGFVLANDFENYQMSSRVISRMVNWQNSAEANEITTVSNVKAPARPFQYTRIQWAGVYKSAEIDKAAYVTIFERSGTVDPKDLGGKLAGKLPLPRSSYEQMATLLNARAIVCDTTALYTKCIFYGLLMAKMRIQHIPLGVPDLIQAPVTYVAIPADPAVARVVINLIGEFTNRGDFVLLEGEDFERRFVPALHLLSIGGASMPPHVADNSLASQSLRWPAIRFLVICNAPLPVFPVGQLPTDEDMRDLAVYLSRARGEPDMLHRAWYQATYLSSCEWISRWDERYNLPDYWPDRHQIIPPPDPRGPLNRDDPIGYRAAVQGANARPAAFLPDHHWHDGRNGEPRAGGQNDYLPLHVPNPAHIIDQNHAAAMAAWERRRDDWVNYRGQYANQRPPGQGVQPREPQDFDEAAPQRPPYPIGQVRQARRGPFEWRQRGANDGQRDAAAAYPEPRADEDWPIDHNEWGVYLAARNCYRACTPFLECNLLLEMATPLDYNPIWRWLGYKREAPADALLIDNCALTSNLSIDQLAVLSIWASVHVSLGFTTICTDFNLTGSLLQDLTCQHAVSTHFRRFLMNNHFLTRAGNMLMTEQPYASFLIREYIGAVFGAQLPYDILGSRTWACWNVRREPERNAWLAHLNHNIPPRLYRPTGALRWMEYVPIEWGISGPGMEVNLYDEIPTHSFNDANRGWFAWRGTKAYKEYVVANAPYCYVAYGLQVANYLAMRIVARDDPMVQYAPQLIPFSGELCAEYIPQAAVDVLPGQFAQIPGLGIFEPMSHMSYDWATATVLTPAYPNGGNIELDSLLQQKNIKGVITEVGLEWYLSGSREAPLYKDPSAAYCGLFDKFAKMARPDRSALPKAIDKTKIPESNQQKVEKQAEQAPPAAELPNSGVLLPGAPGTSGTSAGAAPPPAAQ